MNFSHVTNPQANAFLKQFLADREINREVYEKIPEDKFDFRMTAKSDSPRESIVHQIETETNYIKGIEAEEIKFGQQHENVEKLKKFSKEALLDKLQERDEALVKLLSDEATCTKLVKVPWSKTPIPAVSALWAMDSHEILHTGWNLALMDHLGIARFPKFTEMWG